MNIVFTKQFKRNFKTRIRPNNSLQKRFNKRLVLFKENPYNPILNLHKLKGKKKKLYAFSVTGDVRVILSIEKSKATFSDIGTHNQVY